MTIRLVYHSPESLTGGFSPFDDSIIEIVTGRDVRIACPYLTIGILERIVMLCADWRLLTDLDAWLVSHAQEKNGIEEFILTHKRNVRHYKNIHAKVLIGGTKALVGSANFTQSGISKNVEVSVAFDDLAQINELNQWFDLQWTQAATVAEADLHRSVESASPRVPPRVFVPLPWSGTGIESMLRPFWITRFDDTEIARRREQWRIRPNDWGPQQLCMAAIYSALGKLDRGFTDESAVEYWNRLKNLGLGAFGNYTGDPRDNFRRRLSDKYALLVKCSDGLHRLDRDVTAATIGIPPDVADAAETIVSAIDAKMSDAEIQANYGGQVRVLNGFTKKSSLAFCAAARKDKPK